MSALIYTRHVSIIIDMVVICKNWQALPVSATTVTAPIIEDRAWPAPVSSYTPPLDPIQWPTAHLSSKPDIVELHKINHNEPNEPAADTINVCDAPPPVWPKKRLYGFICVDTAKSGPEKYKKMKTPAKIARL